MDGVEKFVIEVVGRMRRRRVGGTLKGYPCGGVAISGGWRLGRLLSGLVPLEVVLVTTSWME